MNDHEAGRLARNPGDVAGGAQGKIGLLLAAWVVVWQPMKDAQPEEWEMPPQAERLSIAPEDQPRFQRLLAELAFSAAGAVIFPASACMIPDLGSFSTPSSPPLTLWEQAFYQWFPNVLALLAIACVVWLLTIPLRMSDLWRR